MANVCSSNYIYHTVSSLSCLMHCGALISEAQQSRWIKSHFICTPADFPCTPGSRVNHNTSLLASLQVQFIGGVTFHKFHLFCQLHKSTFSKTMITLWSSHVRLLWKISAGKRLYIYTHFWVARCVVEEVLFVCACMCAHSQQKRQGESLCRMAQNG